MFHVEAIGTDVFSGRNDFIKGPAAIPLFWPRVRLAACICIDILDNIIQMMEAMK